MTRNTKRIFYGWWIVVAAFLIAFYQGGFIIYGFTVIFEPIANETGWSYTLISLASSIRGVEAGLLAPVVGILVDRWGPRKLIFVGTIANAAGLLALSYATSLAMFYTAMVLIALGTTACTSTVLMTTVANWFRKKQGIASGIVMSGFGFSGLLVPLLVWLVELYQWRGAMAITAIGMLVLALPLAVLFRHKPEQYGYLPDGETEEPAMLSNAVNLPRTPEIDISAKEALKSGTFWRLALVYFSFLLLLHATTTHVMPYLSSIGIPRSTSGLVATAIPLTSIGGRLGMGWLGDKLNQRRVQAVGLAMMGLGMCFFGYAATASAWLLVPFIILFGFGYGGTGVLRAAMVREYFGRRNFGTIFGLVMGVSILGSITGPPLAGWVYDHWGSYGGIWFVFAAFTFVGIISILTIRPVRKSVELTSES